MATNMALQRMGSPLSLARINKTTALRPEQLGPATRRTAPQPARRQQRFWSAVTSTDHSAPADTLPSHPDFKLPVAVALAAASFQSYLDPSGAQPHLEDRTARGTHTTYMSKEHLLKTFQGALQLTIKDASNLVVGDHAKEDRTILSVGKGSSIIRDAGPTWGQSFTLYIRDLNSEKLKLSSTDDRLFGKDVQLGSVEHDLDIFQDLEYHILDLTLPGKDKKPATVKLEGIFVPFDDKTAVAFIADDPQVEPVPDKRAAVVGDYSISDKVARTVAAASGKASPLAPPKWRDLCASVDAGAVVDLDKLLQPIAFIENVYSDTQVYISRSEELHTIVVSFRGTQSVKKEDLVSDVRLLQEALYEAGSALAKEEKKIKVHRGFVAAHKSVQDEVASLVDELTSDGSKGPWKVYVTGHSLGGALATLCSYALVSRDDDAKKNQAVAKYTYGEPRVGNEDFAKDFNSKHIPAFRLVNPKDVVPKIPYLMGYCHVNTGVALKDEGGYSFITASEQLPGDGAGLVDLPILTIRGVLELFLPFIKKEHELVGIVKEQATIAASLANGSGVSQHSGDYYFKTLSKTVELAKKARQ